MKLTIIAATKFAEQLNQSTETSLKRGIQQVKAKLGQSVKKMQEGKIMHGQYIRSVDRQLTGAEDTLPWQQSGDLEGEARSEVMAAQDQALQTKYHATKILQTETERK